MALETMEAVILDGTVFTPGEIIPAWVWRRVPRRQQNTLLNTGRVRMTLDTERAKELGRLSGIARRQKGAETDR